MSYIWLNVFALVMEYHCDDVVWRVRAVFSKIAALIYEDTKLSHESSVKRKWRVSLPAVVGWTRVFRPAQLLL